MWSLAHHDVFGIRFTEDAFRLAFFGNKAYEGTTATLDGSAHERQRFQTVAFGIQDARTGSFLQLEVVNGQYLNASDLEEASLRTAAQGIELDARVNGTYWQNDTAGSAAFGRSNGWGLAVSGRWAVGDDAFDIPLVCVEQEPHERLLVIRVPAGIGLDDDAITGKVGGAQGCRSEQGQQGQARRAKSTRQGVRIHGASLV